MTALAMFGGPKTVTSADATRARVGWPVVSEAEHDAIREVLDSGVFSSIDGGRGEVSALERDWAGYVGAGHCVAVSDGTSAIEIALAALDIEPGSEVLVPALTFIGSAIPVVRRMLVPVFVDIDPATFNISVAGAAAAVTPRTRAIIAVHLHGLPADLDGLRALATRHGLHLIEDLAQAHGARYRGQRVGSIGDINAASLNVVKNLPTCGEGGLITTDDEQLRERAVLGRQFGENLAGRERDYLSRVLAGNAKMSAVQAAFTRRQLMRLDAYAAARQRNVQGFLGALAELPGIAVPAVPADRSHAWHILRLRFRPADIGWTGVPPGVLRAVVHRALRAEGVPLQPYQIVPLPGQPAFQQLAGFGGYPWRLSGVPEPRYRIEDYPDTLAVIDDSLTLQRWHLNPAAGPVLMRCAEAFGKVWSQLDSLLPVARSWAYHPPWHRADDRRPSPAGVR
jgi:perosamine synthetase